MSKRIRIIIAAAAALLVLIAAVLVLTLWPENEQKPVGGSSDITSSESANIYGYLNVFAFEKEQIRSVVAKNENGGFTLNQAKENEWSLSGAEGFELNSEALESLTDSCTEFLATKEIAENPADLSVYGITDKSVTATVSYSTGEKLTFMVGDETAAGNTYVYLKQNDKVYFVDSGWSLPFELKYTGYLDLTISDGIETDEDGNDIDPHVTKISYTGRGLKKPIVIEENPEYVAELKRQEAEEQESSDSNSNATIAALPCQFMFTSPFKADISDEAFAGKQNDYLGISATDVYALNPTAAELKACGLSDPYVKIQVVAAKRTLMLYLGNTVTVDDTQYYYVTTSERKPIFLVEKTHFTFFQEDMINYMSPIVVNAVIDRIDTLTMEYKGEKYEFESSGEGDDLVVRWNGKKMSTEEYRDLYQLIMLVYCEESVEQGEYTGNAELKITYTYRKLEKVDVVEYVKAEPRKYLIRLNGSDLAQVRSKYVDALAYGLTQFISGRDVPSDY